MSFEIKKINGQFKSTYTIDLDLNLLKNPKHTEYFKYTTHENELYNSYWEHGYNFPKHLYKYTKIHESTFDDIENNLIYVSNPKIFEDKLDIYLTDIFPGNVMDYNQTNYKNIFNEKTYEKFIEMVNKIAIENIPLSEIILIVDNFINKYKITNINPHDLTIDIELLIEQANVETLLEWKHWRENTFIYCVTDTFKYQHMWNDYSGHDGICIEYDFSDVDPLKNEYCICTFPVQYSDKLYELKKVPYPKKIFSFLYFYSALIKLKKFQMENEWRYIIQCTGKSEDFENKVPYQKISAIYMGYKISTENKDKLTKLCKENNLKLYQMNVNLDFNIII